MMTHGHLGFHSPHRLKSNTNDNQNGSTTQRNVGLGQSGEEDGEDCDDTQEHCAQQSDLGEDLGEVIHSGFTGANTGDRAVALPQIVGNLHRIVLNSGVEVVEAKNQQEVQNAVEGVVVLEQVEETSPETALFDLRPCWLYSCHLWCKS